MCQPSRIVDRNIFEIYLTTLLTKNILWPIKEHFKKETHQVRILRSLINKAETIIADESYILEMEIEN